LRGRERERENLEEENKRDAGKEGVVVVRVGTR
jgi:hypothetical protein